MFRFPKPFSHHEHPREIIRQFTPNWFTATMGTGATALVLNQFPVPLPGLHARRFHALAGQCRAVCHAIPALCRALAALPSGLGQDPRPCRHADGAWRHPDGPGHHRQRLSGLRHRPLWRRRRDGRASPLVCRRHPRRRHRPARAVHDVHPPDAQHGRHDRPVAAAVRGLRGGGGQRRPAGAACRGQPRRRAHAVRLLPALGPLRAARPQHPGHTVPAPGTA